MPNPALDLLDGLSGRFLKPVPINSHPPQLEYRRALTPWRWRWRSKWTNWDQHERGPGSNSNPQNPCGSAPLLDAALLRQQRQRRLFSAPTELAGDWAIC
jgi:hypothetical protein